MVDSIISPDRYIYEYIPDLSLLVYKNRSPVIQKCMLTDNTRQKTQAKYQFNVQK